MKTLSCPIFGKPLKFLVHLVCVLTLIISTEATAVTSHCISLLLTSWGSNRFSQWSFADNPSPSFGQSAHPLAFQQLKAKLNFEEYKKAAAKELEATPVEAMPRQIESAFFEDRKIPFFRTRRRFEILEMIKRLLYVVDSNYNLYFHVIKRNQFDKWMLMLNARYQNVITTHLTMNGVAHYFLNEPGYFLICIKPGNKSALNRYAKSVFDKYSNRVCIDSLNRSFNDAYYSTNLGGFISLDTNSILNLKPTAMARHETDHMFQEARRIQFDFDDFHGNFELKENLPNSTVARNFYDKYFSLEELLTWRKDTFQHAVSALAFLGDSTNFSFSVNDLALDLGATLFLHRKAIAAIDVILSATVNTELGWSIDLNSMFFGNWNIKLRSVIFTAPITERDLSNFPEPMANMIREYRNALKDHYVESRKKSVIKNPASVDSELVDSSPSLLALKNKFKATYGDELGKDTLQQLALARLQLMRKVITEQQKPLDEAAALVLQLANVSSIEEQTELLNRIRNLLRKPR